MNAFSTPPGSASTVEALREAYRSADRPTRHQLVSALPPAEIEFAGVRMLVDPRDNYTERMIWLDGQPPEMASLMALVDLIEGRRAFVLDVGANCGAFTVPLALAAAQESRIIAFEPNPIMIGRLGHNLLLNGIADRVRIESCALGAGRGTATLHLKRGNLGQASLNPMRDKARAGSIIVPLRPLTDFVSEAEDCEVSLLKIDVEGAEVAVLKPLLEQGSWLPDILLMETRHAESWDTDLITLLAEAGYETRLEADGNTLFVQKDAAH